MAEYRDSFIDALSKPQPDPGGGAAAAYAGSVALALAEKIVRLELARSGEGSEDAHFWEALLVEGRSLREGMDVLRRQDVEAYAALSRALASPDREKELPPAFRDAMGCPLNIMEEAGASLVLIAKAGRRCKKHLVADLQVACEILGAVAEGAYHIARANLLLIKDVPEVTTHNAELSRTRERCAAQAVRTRHELASRFAPH